VAVSFAPKQFGAARSKSFPTVNPFEARKEIGSFGGWLGLRWYQPGDHPLALRDLDLLSLLKEVFNMRKSIPKVPNRRFLHVMHYCITTSPDQAHASPKSSRVPQPGPKTRQ
jgi:hypothetical protein